MPNASSILSLSKPVIIGSSEFSVGEFKDSKTPEALIEAIKTKTNIDFPSTDVPIESLNKLLQRQDLYKVMTARPVEASDLIHRLE